MAKSAIDKMVSMMAKGKTPDASSLSLGKEEFVHLIQEAFDSGLIEGERPSFCDSQEASLSSCRLTEKGKERAGKSFLARLMAKHS